MKNFVLIAVATFVLLGGGLRAQSSAPESAPAITPLEWNSPLNHLETAATLAKTANIRPYNCWQTLYHNPTASSTNISDTTPSRIWAMRMTLPTHPLVNKCTVANVGIDFRWVPKQQGKIDTMHIFMREVTAPYNQFYHVRYLMKLGENVGEIEIDPPFPGNPRPIINPKRDVYIGLYITGQTGSQITWRIKSPSLYTNPLRSVIFHNGVPVAPGAVVGQNGDWVFSGLCCCPPIPVELSTFTGYYEGNNVSLHWRTESETNNFHFEVERALQPQGPWTSRGVVPGNGTTRTPQDYSFSDYVGGATDVPASYWYRLRQMDYDGTINEIPPIRVATAPASAIGFTLKTPYPNPIQSNSYTTIAYELPVEAPVTMEVYDAIGKKIATLVDRTVPAGYHEALWYPSLASRPLPEGTYFVRVSTNTFMETRKVTLLR